MIKLSDHLDIPPMSAVVNERRAHEAKRTKAEARKNYYSRMYQAAKMSRSNSDWTVTPTSGNAELRNSLRSLRARARQMARDNSHFKKFLSLVKNNVVGPKGIKLQSRARAKDGTLNVELNKLVEECFWDWSHRETCSASGKLSWLDAQKLFATTLARDGEVLVQKVYPKDNKFGFALKFIDVSYLDETFNSVAPNGNRILMSIEVDKNDRPVRYWLTTPTSDYVFEHDRKMRVPVDASEIIHAFLPNEDEAQARGVTWFHAAMLDAKNLQGYRDGVITSARAAACSFATITPPDDAELSDEHYDDDGNLMPVEIDVQPLSIHELPPGYKMEAFDPKQPTQNHSAFNQAILMDVAAGLDVVYFQLAGDMSAVNFSSARVGLNEERDVWRGVQTFVIEHFCNDVFHAWLESAFLSGVLKVSVKDLKEIKNPQFRGRSWEYLEPVKDMQANILALEHNLTTYTDVLAERGVDLIDLLERRRSEKEMAAKYGITLEIAPKKAPPEGNSGDRNPSDDENQEE